MSVNRDNNLLEYVFSSHKCWVYKNYNEFEPGRKKDDKELLLDNPDIPYFPVERIPNSWTPLSQSFSEEDFEKNYGNPFAALNHKRIIVVVSKTEDKVALKVFNYFRNREVGKKFFRISTSVNYISYNFKTNCLYHGWITNYHKKRKFHKRVKKNCFGEDPLNRIGSILSSFLNDLGRSDKELLLQKNDILHKVMNTFVDNIPGTEKHKDLDLQLRIYRVHLDSIGVKLSNNWTAFSKLWPLPKKKDFVKNKMKYVDAIMSVQNLKGDKLRKVLHQVDDIRNIYLYHWFTTFFGEDFTLSLPTDFLKRLFESNISNPYTHDYSYSNNFSKKELLNIFEIFKLCLDRNVDTQSFADHIRYITRLRIFEEVKWKAKTQKEFIEEHLDISEKLSFYTKGDFERKYNIEFLEEIEKVITLDQDYYPVVLKNSREYNKESFIQSNCVKNYVNKASSLIISLRKNSVDSNERATIEFRITKIKDKLFLRRVQTLGRFNNNLSSDWDDSLRLLDSRVEMLLSKNLFKLFSLELKMGYKSIKSDVVFKDKSYYLGADNDEYLLDWNNPEINNIHFTETPI